MIDKKGRVWLAAGIRGFDNPAFCKKGSDHPSAKVAPQNQSARQLSMYDPATGKWSLVGPMSLAAIAAGASGLIIEVHPTPNQALSDGAQSLDFAAFAIGIDGTDHLDLSEARERGHVGGVLRQDLRVEVGGAILSGLRVHLIAAGEHRRLAAHRGAVDPRDRPRRAAVRPRHRKSSLHHRAGSVRQR